MAFLSSQGQAWRERSKFSIRLFVPAKGKARGCWLPKTEVAAWCTARSWVCNDKRTRVVGCKSTLRNVSATPLQRRPTNFHIKFVFQKEDTGATIRTRSVMPQGPPIATLQIENGCLANLRGGKCPPNHHPWPLSSRSFVVEDSLVASSQQVQNSFAKPLRN